MKAEKTPMSRREQVFDFLLSAAMPMTDVETVGMLVVVGRPKCQESLGMSQVCWRKK